MKRPCCREDGFGLTRFIRRNNGQLLVVRESSRELNESEDSEIISRRSGVCGMMVLSQEAKEGKLTSTTCGKCDRIILATVVPATCKARLSIEQMVKAHKNGRESTVAVGNCSLGSDDIAPIVDVRLTWKGAFYSGDTTNLERVTGGCAFAPENIRRTTEKPGGQVPAAIVCPTCRLVVTPSILGADDGVWN